VGERAQLYVNELWTYVSWLAILAFDLTYA
jgi:hypothetical protein